MHNNSSLGSTLLKFPVNLLYGFWLLSLYNGTFVHELNLFYDSGEDGHIFVHVENIAMVIFVTQWEVHVWKQYFAKSFCS